MNQMKSEAEHRRGGSRKVGVAKVRLVCVPLRLFALNNEKPQTTASGAYV